MKIISKTGIYPPSQKTPSLLGDECEEKNCFGEISQKSKPETCQRLPAGQQSGGPAGQAGITPNFSEVKIRDIDIESEIPKSYREDFGITPTSMPKLSKKILTHLIPRNSRGISGTLPLKSLAFGRRFLRARRGNIGTTPACRNAALRRAGMGLPVGLHLFFIIAVFSFGSLNLQAAPARREPRLKTTQLAQQENLTLPQEWQKEIALKELKGVLRTRTEIINALYAYLKKNPKILGGLDASQLKPVYISQVGATTNKSSLVYVDFIQQYQGLDVAGSYAHFSIKPLSDRSIIMSGRIKVYPKIAKYLAKVKAVTSKKQTKQIATSSASQTPLKERKLIRFLKGRWTMVAESPVLEKGLTQVRDERSGKTYFRDDRLYAISGDVKGRGVEFDPSTTGGNLTTFNLRDLRVIAILTGGYADTNANGEFNFPSLSSSTNVKGSLAGIYIGVFDNPPVASLNFNVAATPNVPVHILLNPTGADEVPTAQINAYYHAIYIREWVKARLGNLLPAIDSPLRIAVNALQLCRSSYSSGSPPSITFSKSGGGCINTAYDTFIYHEFGHFVDDKAGGITSSSLSDGWGDILATFATNQPLIGEGIRGIGTFKRTADNNYQYPADGQGEPSIVGQAWTGFAWHLRQNLINSRGETAGTQAAENLIISLFIANSPGIPQAVWDVVLADDDDNNLTNGTPHLQEIVSAAQQHNLFPFYNLSVAQILPFSLTGQQGSITISGTADTSSLGLPFKDYQLFYGNGNNPTTWIPIGPPVSTPVTNGTLGVWLLNNKMSTGYYSFKLVVTTTTELKFQHCLKVGYENPAPTQITTDEDSQEAPAISGDYIVWQDDRNSSDTGYDIYSYNLSTNQEKRITTDVDYQEIPAISGNYIVWQDDRNYDDGYDIYSYNLSTNQEKRVTTDADEQEVPAISGNYIVWQDDRNYDEGYDIYRYKISPSGEKRITSDENEQQNPAISGNYIAWEDNRNNNWDIYLYNLSDNTERQITTANALVDHLNPAVSGNYIVWQDDRNNNFDIYLYNLSDNTERQITTDPADQINPAISGNLIVWEDQRNGDSDVYLYDLSTNTEQRITANSNYQGVPAIDGQRVVWEDGRNSNPDIYSLVYNGSVANNHPPALGNIGNQVVDENSTVTFAISASDSDGDSLSLFSTTGLPAGAIFTDNGNGSGTFTWTPTYAQSGNYSVSFAASDGLLNDEKSCTISVNDVSLNISVLTDNPDPFNPNNNATTISGQFSHEVNNWKLEIKNASGTLVRTFIGTTPTASVDQAWDGKDESGNIVPEGSYKYILQGTDAGGNTAAANGWVTVNTNVSPLNITALVDNPDPFNPNDNATAISGQFNHEVTNWTLEIKNASGTLVRTFTGTTPTASIDQAWDGKDDSLNLVADGAYDYILQGTDAGSNTATAAGTVSVIKNRAPVLGDIGNQQVNEDSTLNFTVSATDNDNDPLTLSASGFPLDLGAQFTDNGNGSGSFNWKPNYEQSGEYYITFTVSDGQTTDSEEIIVKVNNTNRQPILGAISDRAIKTGEELKFTLSASDPDGDGLNYSVSGLPSNASLGAKTGEFTWRPPYEQAGTHKATFTVTDNGESALSDSHTAAILVEATQFVFSFNPASPQVFVNNPLTLTVRATDKDYEEFILSARSLPKKAKFKKIKGMREVSQNLEWTPTIKENQVGDQFVTFTAVNKKGVSESQDIIIKVENHAPVFAALPPDGTIIYADQKYSFEVSAQDEDKDKLTLTAEGLPKGAKFSKKTGKDGRVTQTLKWKPKGSEKGTYQVTFNVTDGYATTTTQPINLTVANTAPALDKVNVKPFKVNKNNTLDVSFKDVDKDNLTLTAQGLPTGATLETTGSEGKIKGKLKWKPLSVGNYSVTFSVSDNDPVNPQTASTAVTINVVAR